MIYYKLTSTTSTVWILWQELALASWHAKTYVQKAHDMRKDRIRATTSSRCWPQFRQRS